MNRGSGGTRPRRLERWALAAIVLFGVVGGGTYAAWRDAAQAAVLPQTVGNFWGIWYPEGNLETPAYIVQQGNALTLMNEQGRVSRGSATIDTLVANDWEGGIRGTLTPDQRHINWSNGTHWLRRAALPGQQPGLPNVAGVWYSEDDANKPTLVVQTGGTLMLLNEVGTASPGQWTGPQSFVATAWEGGVTGQLSPDGHYLSWSNGTHWRR